MAAAADEGWRTSAPQPVSLTATGGHGAVTVHYVLDGAAQADVAGAASFDVAGDGSHTLEYWATDELGNEETHHTGHVNIDTRRAGHHRRLRRRQRLADRPRELLRSRRATPPPASTGRRGRSTAARRTAAPTSS